MPGSEEGHSVNISSCLLLPGQAGNTNHSVHYKYIVNDNYLNDNCNKN